MKQALTKWLEKPVRGMHPVLRLLMIFLPVALLICGGGYLYYRSQLHFIHEENRKMEHETVMVGVVSINRSLEYVMQDVRVLYSSTDFRKMLDHPDTTNLDNVANNIRKGNTKAKDTAFSPMDHSPTTQTLSPT